MTGVCKKCRQMIMSADVDIHMPLDWTPEQKTSAAFAKFCGIVAKHWGEQHKAEVGGFAPVMLGVQTLIFGLMVNSTDKKFLSELAKQRAEVIKMIETLGSEVVAIQETAPGPAN